MDVLPLHFRVLYYDGLWWESDKQHWFVKFIWKPLVVSSIFLFALSTLSALAIHNNDVRDVTKCLFISLTVLALFFKIVNFLWKRERMIELLKKFREPICMPRTSEESEIFKRNARLIQIVFKCYCYVAYTSGTLFFLVPLFQFYKFGQMNFAFETYEIFSKENVTFYSVNYTFQVLTSLVGMTLNGAFDTILAGFIRLTCGQIDLCCHRFITENGKGMLEKLKECAVHHRLIQEIVRDLEAIFMAVIVPFLFMSLFTICTSVYNLAQRGITNVESIPFLVYTGAMMMQVFFYCWFGSELTIKGMKISKTMYHYNWKVLNPIEKKHLLFIMFVGQKPLALSFHGYFRISLDIYVWILNTSYAAYNILQALTKAN